jgi:hypothetical protein
MTPAEIDALVARTIGLAQSYRRAATSLLDEAHARLGAGRMKTEEFNRVFGNYLSVLQKAMDVNNAAAHGLAEAVGPVLAAVEDQTASLERKLRALQHTEDLLLVSVKLLVAMGAVALAVLAPTPVAAGAAVVAIGDAIGTVVGVSGDA